MGLDPFLLTPILKERTWGGSRLAGMLGLKPAAKIGEAWLVADLPSTIPEGRSKIASGPFAGATIHDMMGLEAEALLGRAAPTQFGGFPLLVKLLDAAEDLSIQVHPDARYAASHPDSHLKSEAWLVLRAEPGARILRGVRPELSREDFEGHVRKGATLPPEGNRLLQAFVTVKATPGACIWLPSGLCHALGAGVLVAEVQTPSDTTFRLYDWGRKDKMRPLAIDEALQCCLLGGEQHLSTLDEQRPMAPMGAGVAKSSLVSTEHFSMSRIHLNAGAAVDVAPSGLPESWVILAGTGTAVSGKETLALRQGASLVIPATAGSVSLRAATEVDLLRTRIPAPPPRNTSRNR